MDATIERAHANGHDPEEESPTLSPRQWAVLRDAAARVLAAQEELDGAKAQMQQLLRILDLPAGWQIDPFNETISRGERGG